MHLSRKAQSVIEYVLVFVLVGMGIAIMGPYAIRSINGHMKAWEDSIDDSLTDSLPDVDPTGLPTPRCACSDNLPHGCGLGGCPLTSMLYQTDCRPLGCCDNPSTCPINPLPPPPRCVSDGACCTPWAAVGSGSCRGEEGCPIGEVFSSRECGGGVGTQTGCQPSSTCVFECIGNKADDSHECPGARVGLRRDKNWELAANCVPSVKCLTVCDACFHINPTGDACDPDPCCNDGFCNWPIEDCSCPDCNGGCPGGTCNQGSCGPGFCEQR